MMTLSCFHHICVVCECLCLEVGREQRRKRGTLEKNIFDNVTFKATIAERNSE